MNPADPIVIAMCSDNNGADFMQVAIKSIFINNKDEDVELHIVTDGFDESVKSQLKKLGDHFNRRIDIHEINPDEFINIPGCGDGYAFPKATCFRFAIPELISSYGKVLYLDTDVIVEKSLRPLWECDIDDAVAAVVLDPGEHNLWKCHIIDELRFEPERYFNAGVLLMNLRLMRENSIGRLAMEWLLDNPDKALFSDQTALNVLLKGKVKYLPAKYNLQHGHHLCYDGENELRRTPELEEARNNPVIIHFTNYKPWQKIGISGLPKNKNRFLYYRDIYPKTSVRKRLHDNHVFRRRVVYALYKLHLYGRTPATIKGCIGFDRSVK